jgi:hypothetical protein
MCGLYVKQIIIIFEEYTVQFQYFQRATKIYSANVKIFRLPDAQF